MKRLSFVAALALVLTVAVPSAGLAADRHAPASVRLTAQVTVNADDPLPVLSIGALVDVAGGQGLVFGEIQNKLPVPLANVMVESKAYDATGQLVATETGISLFRIMNPGDKAPFFVPFTTGSFTKFTAQVVDYTPSLDYGNHNFNLQTGAESYDAGGTLSLPVTITNTNTIPVDDVELSFIFFNSDGSAANVGYLPLTETLGPGKSGSLTVSAQAGQHARFEVFAESTTAPSLAIVLNEPATSPKVGSKVMLHGTAQPRDAVHLQELVGGQWADVPGTAVKADETGAFAIPYVVPDSVVVRAETGNASSSPIVIFATQAATLKASVTTVLKGKPVVLTGSVLPAAPGSYVTIQRKVGSTYVKVAKVALNSSSKFSYKWVPKVKGTYLLSVSVPDINFVYGTRSNTVKVIVK